MDDLLYIDFEKDYYKVAEITEIVVKEFDIPNIDITNTADERYMRFRGRIKEALDKKVEELSKTTPMEKLRKPFDQKTSVYSNWVVSSVINHDLYGSLFKRGGAENIKAWNEAKNSCRKMKKALEKAEKNGTLHDDPEELQKQDEQYALNRQQHSTDDEEVFKERRKEIAIQFVLDHCVGFDANQLKKEIEDAKARIVASVKEVAEQTPLTYQEIVEKAIATELDKIRVNIVIDFICTHCIKIKEALLKQDIVIAHEWQPEYREPDEVEVDSFNRYNRYIFEGDYEQYIEAIYCEN